MRIPFLAPRLVPVLSMLIVASALSACGGGSGGGGFAGLPGAGTPPTTPPVTTPPETGVAPVKSCAP
ncbi:hypothetical protein J2W32_004053 [Variovorax boronicumulans]|uniref:Uncharacterized protein n=2 Tax=Variovorax TaxID=34072 RepID=A0AAW8CYB2_9BURK|nr:MULTISPECIES: hypothetical protein [Variovorax]ADU35368.1 hypothetical protein Varpa_1150 [Variovorax paradoxus EPS]MDP9895177.1 hypothetical protein [Variovorax boronicumulans]MDQ0034214.1 hypothetical protein [Variovorax boronicumulans]MDQ0054995.1 hypothetical protein [Variovorax boronicumulans]MDQ0610376.1 hypothetical protein [Variovorax sp. W1I1]